MCAELYALPDAAGSLHTKELACTSTHTCSSKMLNTASISHTQPAHSASVHLPTPHPSTCPHRIRPPAHTALVHLPSVLPDRQGTGRPCDHHMQRTQC